ncbi:MAG: HNH endonuclease [Novosphingobium sp.]
MRDVIFTEERHCWLCARELGRRVEWHHPVPKSRGGREKVPVHAICHRVIHANFSNAELARLASAPEVLRDHPTLTRFLRWIAGKPPDFHARTHSRRG